MTCFDYKIILLTHTSVNADVCALLPGSVFYVFYYCTVVCGQTNDDDVDDYVCHELVFVDITFGRNSLLLLMRATWHILDTVDHCCILLVFYKS